MTETEYLAIAAGLFGALFGSFLNVCIVRLPANESVVHPRSRCPGCGNQIAWYDNIPVLSWVFLRAKCRNCAQPISPLYPFVEMLVALAWGLSFWLIWPLLEALTAAVFLTLLIGITATDARSYIIPDEFTWGGLVLGLALSLRNGVPGLTEALAGAALGFGLLYGVAWAGEKAFGKEAMGGGDIKMMAMVGSFVGWMGVPLTLFGGALIGLVVFTPVYEIRRRRTGQETLVPFGIFLSLAAGPVFLFGNLMISWYRANILGL